MQTLLTIVTITKDDLEGVAATIQSSRKLRGCPGVRQIIIDGSDVQVQQKVQALIIGEENIDYLWQEPRGIAQALNQGVNSSNSEWIWFLNGRDEAHPDLDAHFLMRILCVTQSEIIICEIESMQSGLRHKHPPLWAVWPPLHWVPHPATLIRRELFYRYGLFNKEFNIAMDGDLWVRFFTKDISIDMLSIPISLFDQHGISSTDTANVMREADKIVINNFGLLFKLWFTRGLYFFTALRRYFMSQLFPGKGY
jgi:hypothetical protein